MKEAVRSYKGYSEDTFEEAPDYNGSKTLMVQEASTKYVLRDIFILFIPFCLLMSIILVVMKQRETWTMMAPSENKIIPTSTEDKSLQYIKQRNELSRSFNEHKKWYGQQNCELIKLKGKAGETGGDGDVSEYGGWCEELSKSASTFHVFDKGFAKSLSKFLKGKVVGSFGDGPGDYKRALDSYKEVASYTAYDGAPFCETTSIGIVHFLDLSAYQYGLPAFDWVVSVEVGEHIPVKFEDIYLDNLARHAREGIILSWAVPGQGGTSHLNLQPLEHVIEQMKKLGFDIDKKAGEPLRQGSKFGWLKANIHVYKRMDPKSFRPLDT